MQTDRAAATSGIEVTPKGVAYCLAQERPAIERRIERHLALATALISYLDAIEPDPDLEPSVGADQCSPYGGIFVGDMLSPDKWPATASSSPGEGSQLRWAQGDTTDREGDEHDGREPEGEEPTLGYTEEIDQEARLARDWWQVDEAELDLDTFEGDALADMEPDVDGEPSLSWSIPGEGTWSQLVGYTTAGRGDMEADYSADDGFGNLTAYASDEEDNLGCEAIRLPDGSVVSDREGSDCGLGVCDDHGIADAGGQMEAFGAVA